jgi:glycine/D-amino acid oxidase-like deaminating enzyme
VANRIQPALRLGRPVWLNSSPAPQQTYPALTGRHQADIAIVGGGMTGALIALAFATSGASVAVVEADLIARGSSAASSALLLQEPDYGLGELARRYGSRTSKRLWQLSHDAVRDLMATLETFRVRCDLVGRDTIFYATNAEGAARLEREFALRTKAGFPARWLTTGSLRDLTGIAGRCGIHSSGSAQFDPFRASAGLMRAAESAGAAIFERSKVTRISTESAGVLVHTRHGSIEARRVVIATGYATPSFRPLAGRFRLYRTYALATRPLSATERREIGLSDVMIWDTEWPYHYARWTSDHRLLMGGGDRLIRPGQRRHSTFAGATRELRADFEAQMPALADLDIEHAWEGVFAMTPDGLPYIGPHRRYPRHWFALGYGGNGMTFGSLAARLLLERWEGVRSPDHALLEFGRIAKR